MNEIKRDAWDLANQFLSQLRNLQLQNNNFDQWNWFVTPTIATIISNFVRDYWRSKSLLWQLKIKSKILFLDSAEPIRVWWLIKQWPRLTYMVSWWWPNQYMPYLHNTPFETHFTSFENRWNRKLINEFTCEDIIKSVRDKDWWSHVDPTLKKEYVEMKKGESLPRKQIGWSPLINPHFSTIRQVSYELLESIERYLNDNEISWENL